MLQQMTKLTVFRCVSFNLFNTFQQKTCFHNARNRTDCLLILLPQLAVFQNQWDSTTGRGEITAGNTRVVVAVVVIVVVVVVGVVVV